LPVTISGTSGFLLNSFWHPFVSNDFISPFPPCVKDPPCAFQIFARWTTAAMMSSSISNRLVFGIAPLCLFLSLCSSLPTPTWSSNSVLRLASMIRILVLPRRQNTPSLIFVAVYAYFILFPSFLKTVYDQKLLVVAASTSEEKSLSPHLSFFPPPRPLARLVGQFVFFLELDRLQQVFSADISLVF